MNPILPLLRVSRRNFGAEAARIRDKTRVSAETQGLVYDIIADVKMRGDAALLEYAERFDGVKLEESELRVEDSEIDEAFDSVGPELVRALRFSLRRIRKVQLALFPRARRLVRSEGFTVIARSRPLPSVGCYAPGGRAAYASTVLMTAGVAKFAGVPRVVLTSPPQRHGKVSPAVLAATKSLSRVAKIVGPGGVYASVAKRLVAADVETDFYAGPTELIVFADGYCKPRFPAWEVIGQAEHGADTLCGLVTYSKEYANEVRAEILKLLPSLERREYIEASLERGFSAICDSESTACGFIDAVAPEHLEILTRDYVRVGERVERAGLKLLGPYSPCAASDYVAGTDHVIPTAGFSASRGALSVLDFLKLDWSVLGTEAGLWGVIKSLKAIAYAEGLPNHYLSTRSRFGELGQP
ncbi:MAG: histidinol dehydrogenase [Thaumarchaeota archaeon]|nr:MAG: histidinol dehydrogenase [Nitrososphaerota archaeon]